MSLCINPSCPRPDLPANDRSRFCQSCGSDLLLENRYRVTRLLSDNNGFSKVYEVNELDTPKILKVLKGNLNANSTAIELFQQEGAVLRQVNNPGIPQVEECFSFQTRDGLVLQCIVMEKVDGANLEEWMNSRDNQAIAQQQAIAWLKQLAQNLHLVHCQQYFHWNIKPSNIILHSPLTPRYQGENTATFSPAIQRQQGETLTLIDFGTARELTYISLSRLSAKDDITPVVSPGYTPPEQVSNQPVPQSDFFALGRTFVFLLTGQHPLTFYDADNDVLVWRSHAPNISPMLADFIDWLMARRPDDRPINTLVILQRIEELERELCHVPDESPLGVVAVVLLAFWASLTRFRPLAWIEYITSSALRLAVFIIVLITIPGVLAVVTPKVICSLGVSSDACPTQKPQKIADVDYFPPEKGTDSQGRTAEFEIAVLSREYEWKLGSPYLIESNGEVIKTSDLQSKLEQEGIQSRLNTPTDIISVGTASCEGSLETEQLRAFERAKNIQLLAKNLFSDLPSVKDYHLLNLGKFKDCNSNSNPSLTSYQRSLIIIGVSKKTDGVLLDEALYDRLKKKPFGDFKLEDYSLGSQESFKLTN
ncbi:MAG TPA: protein kinase [Candidatus Obscuribacterales bacterium]